VLILVQQPQYKSASDSVGAQRKNHFCAIFIEFCDTQKCHTFGGLELVPKRELTVSAACSKVKNALKPFGTIRKKFPLLKTTKNARYVQSLGKKNHFGADSEALFVVRCAENAFQRPRKMQLPLGVSEKNVYFVESLRFCR